MRRGTREVPQFGSNTGTEAAREVEKENRCITVVDWQLPMVPMEIEKEPKSNFPTPENSTTRKETNKSGKLVGVQRVFMKRGVGGQAEMNSSQAIFFPLMGRKHWM